MTWVLWNPVLDHLEIVLVLVQDRCMVCAKRTIGLDIIFNAPMVLTGVRLKWERLSVRLDKVLILTQDRCTVCAKCTIGSEIVFDAPDGITR